MLSRRIYRHDRAGHERRVLTSEKQGRSGDLFSLADPAHGPVSRSLQVCFPGKPSALGIIDKHGCLHVAGADAVDPDAQAAVVHGHRLC